MEDNAAVKRSEVALRQGSYVDWSCALAGAVTAAAIVLVLLTFGSAIGLSLTSPWPGTGMSTTMLVILTSLWVVVSHVGGFALGGYLAGRMRRPWHDTTVAEVEFRDGAHGGLVWAMGVVIGVALASMIALGTARTAASVGAAAAQSAQVDLTQGAVDGLFRSTTPRTAAQDSRDADVRAETGRIVAAALVRPEMRAEDRTYLAQLVASRTGLAPEAAVNRVTEVINDVRAAADRARKAGIIAAFLAAASLLASCAAAWMAAVIGGSHRQKGVIWRGLARHSTAS